MYGEFLLQGDEKTGQIASFLQQVIVNDLKTVSESHPCALHFVLMGLSIEVLGGFLDSKPMKAKGQSAKRFSYAVKYLFGGKYRLLNENGFLYDKLRNQLCHSFLPGGDLLLLEQEQNSAGHTHLQVIEGRLVIVAEDFYRDICNACERLLLLMKEGKVKTKNIAFGNGI